MKILSLLWGYRPGGVTDCVIRYGKLPEQSNFDLKTIIFQKKKWGTDFSGFSGIDIIVIYFNQYPLLNWFIKLIKLLRRNKIRILFAHAFNGAIIGWGAWLFYRKSKLVCSYHGIYVPPVWYKKPLGLIYNKLVIHIYKKYARGIICVSEFSGKELINKGIQKDKIYILYNGIPSVPRLYKNINEPKDGKTIIITVCRLVPLKGIETLIDAVKPLSTISLYIIGDGPLMSSLRARAQDSVCPVIFKGMQNNIDDWLNFADIFVLPSFVENHSISILEAMRSGKAIIASRVGGNPESILDQINGLLFEAGNVSDLQQKLQLLINNPDFRNKLGQSAFEHFQNNFTEEIMHNRLINYFNTI